MFWLCTRRLANISYIRPHFRAFAAAQDVLVGSFGRINDMEYSINSLQGPDSLPLSEYRGFLGGEPVSIHVVANWQLANRWRQLSATCGSKYVLEPKLVHRLDSGHILVFTRKVDCSLEQFFEDNKPLVDSDGFIIPELRIMYRDITEALLQVNHRTGFCHGNVTSHSVKVINGNAFLSCPVANWIGMGLRDQMDAYMFKLLLDAAHPKVKGKESEEVNYFMKALVSTHYSDLSFLIGHHPIFRTLEGKMELWLLLARLTLDFNGLRRKTVPSFTALCDNWDKEYFNVKRPNWGKKLSANPELFGEFNYGHPIMLLVRGRNEAEHKIRVNGEVKFIKVLSNAWKGYLSMLLAVARKYYHEKFEERWSDITLKPNVQGFPNKHIWRQNDVGVSPDYSPFPFLSFRHLKMVTFARLQKEFKECSRDVECSGIKVSLKSDDSLARLIGTIPGPIGTPYEGGTFQIDIEVPDEYPFLPPKMRFTTKVWHPNFSQNGEICLDILKKEWLPGLTLKTALLSVRALLSAPQPHCPQDAVVAQQYLNDYQSFLGTARYWTEIFAKNQEKLLTTRSLD